MARAVLVVALVALGLPVVGCGGKPPPVGGDDAASRLLARILKGESTAAVLSDAPQLGDELLRTVRLRGRKAQELRELFYRDETQEAACITWDWIEANGGPFQVSEEGIYGFALGQFSRPEQARGYAAAVKQLVAFDLGSLASVPTIACVARDFDDGY